MDFCVCMRCQNLLVPIKCHIKTDLKWMQQLLNVKVDVFISIRFWPYVAILICSKSTYHCIFFILESFLIDWVRLFKSVYKSQLYTDM